MWNIILEQISLNIKSNKINVTSVTHNTSKVKYCTVLLNPSSIFWVMFADIPMEHVCESH